MHLNGIQNAINSNEYAINPVRQGTINPFVTLHEPLTIVYNLNNVLLHRSLPSGRDRF